MSMPDGWPGVGDVPEPEPDDFRAEQIKAENQRKVDEAKDQVERNKAKKEELSGKSAPDGPEVEPPEEGAPKVTTKSSKSTKSSD